MRSLSAGKWLIVFFSLVLVILLAAAALVVYIDPYFHYHKPLEQYYYPLNNQRCQNDGILKHFEYDGIITGTSMTENFKTSEAGDIFHHSFVKIPFSGGSYKEINDNVITALSCNEDVAIVIRSLDMNKFSEDRDYLRTDMGEYPSYLYNSNPFDDVYYVFNKDVLLRCTLLVHGAQAGQRGGFTPFDEYSDWMESAEFGKETVLKDLPMLKKAKSQATLKESEKRIIHDNVQQNVVATAEANPDVEFYYFFPPYSVAWWGHLLQGEDGIGVFDKQIEMEKYVIQMVLDVPNIHLYSFNDKFDITTDLDNYKDELHYGEWINSKLLSWMKEGEGLLTSENYKEYLEREQTYYSDFDYNSLY